MIQCQECQTDTIVKNGIVPEKQCYKCKSCGGNFIIGDYGTNPATELKRQTGVLFYSLGKASFRIVEAITVGWIVVTDTGYSFLTVGLLHRLRLVDQNFRSRKICLF